jgi:hypothetical protein
MRDLKRAMAEQVWDLNKKPTFRSDKVSSQARQVIYWMRNMFKDMRHRNKTELWRLLTLLQIFQGLIHINPLGAAECPMSLTWLNTIDTTMGQGSSYFF